MKGKNNSKMFIGATLLIGLCGLTMIQCQQMVFTNEDNKDVTVKLANHLGNSVDIQSLPDNAFLIQKNEGDTILSYTQIQNPNEIDASQMDIRGTFNSNHDLKVKGDLHIASQSNSIYYKTQQQWKLFAFDDFQSEKKGWSEQTISSCGSSENIFLGGYCNFGGVIVNKEYTDIPPNSYVTVHFNYHFFDEWNGELAFAQINGVTMWQESYTWCNKLMIQQCKNQGINICGRDDIPDRYSYSVSFSFYNDVATSFILSVGSNLTRNPCEASWGLDDVQIYIQ